MDNHGPGSLVSRRTALTGIGASGLGLAIAANTRQLSAQGASLADHPLAGTWLTLTDATLPETSQLPHLSVFSTDGTVTLTTPPSDIGPDGPVLLSPYVGIWEAHDERRGHFRATQTLSNLDGVVVGMVTVDGYPLVSEDGQSFSDDGELVTITVRDAQGVVLDSFNPGASGRPVRGNRLTFENMTFPSPLPVAGTPTS